MEQAVEKTGLDQVRDARADLHAALVKVEKAIAGPQADVAWMPTVHDVLVDLAATFERHIAVTEAPDGLFDDVLRAAPRLSNVVRRLCGDHAEIRRQIADLLTDVRQVGRADQAQGSLRDRSMDLLAKLSRHRQTGADLVYEAYTVDIGGSE